MHVHIIRDYVPWVSSLGHAHDYDSATNNNTPKTHDSDALTSASWIMNINKLIVLKIQTGMLSVTYLIDIFTDIPIWNYTYHVQSTQDIFLAIP